MSNNHKQKVYSVLDSLTATELNNYIRDRNINLKAEDILHKLNRIRKPENHREKISLDISESFRKVLQSYYHLGMAWVISFVFECFYDDKYKIADLKEYLHALIKDNKEIKEMVYDCMKDF